MTWVRKKFGSEKKFKSFVRKNPLTIKNFGSEKVSWSKKFLVRKKILSEKFLVQKIIGKKNLVENKSLVKKFFGEKIFQSNRNFWSKTYVSQKIFNLRKIYV